MESKTLFFSYFFPSGTRSEMKQNNLPKKELKEMILKK